MKIIRVVKMTFREDVVNDFIFVFDAHKDKIRHFEGCTHLELLRDANDPCVYYTYSHWDSAEHLDAYRDSELFGKVWPATRKLFAARPMAFSATVEQTVD